MQLRPTSALLLLAAACAPIPRHDSRQPDALLRPPPEEWLHHGRTYDNQRFSPLAQITRETVSRLRQVGVLEVTVPRTAGLQATPLVAGGIMYMTTSYNSAFAFDLRSRAKLWQYDHPQARAIFCCGPVNRGVALSDGRLFMATLDARLVALDARTGRVLWNVVTHPADSGYSNTMAPLVIGDNVIVGVSGGEYGIRGSVSAYDARSGTLRWRFYTVPLPSEGGWWGSWVTSTPWGDRLPRNIALERADSARFAETWRIGGAPVWSTPAYDPDLGLIFFGTGNPSPSNDGSKRPGDNLYNNSTIAIEAATGKLRWYVQHIPHDMWDYDLPNPPILATVGGRKLVLHASKEGWVYMMDAATGERVRRSEAFVPQENMFVPPTDSGTLMRPGIFGGANWPPSSFSPQTGYMYVPARDRPQLITRADAEYEAGRLYVGGGTRRLPTPPSPGLLAAIDVASGRVAWTARGPVEVWGGTLATAGGIVFMGETDGWFRAYDSRTGDVLWSAFCNAGVDSSPVTYELDGRQYVAVAAGGSRYGTLKGNSVFLFALSDSALIRSSSMTRTAPRPSM